MMMMMIIIMIMIMIMTIVSVEQRPGWGEHVINPSFPPERPFDGKKKPCSNNGAEIPQRSTLEPQWQTHKLGA
jgi:hypothetical protein